MQKYKILTKYLIKFAEVKKKKKNKVWHKENKQKGLTYSRYIANIWKNCRNTIPEAHELKEVLLTSL